MERKVKPAAATLLLFCSIFSRSWIGVNLTMPESANHIATRSRQESIVMVTYVIGEKSATNGYLQTFIESLRHQSNFQVNIVGTPKPPFPLPPNVRHVEITWEELAGRVSDKLFGGRNATALSQASIRKIIDLKPLYATLFPEHVRGYDWWGHMDNDMLLGDLRQFLTPTLLSNHDLISPTWTTLNRNYGQTSGPFQLFRNDNVTNDLFRLSPCPLEETFNISNAVGFDEWFNGFNCSMSGIVRNWAPKLGLRFHAGFPKGDLTRRCKSGCHECILTMPPHGGSTRQSVVCRKGEGSKTFEVLYLHFQHGKPEVEESIRNATFRAELIKGGQIRAKLPEGYGFVNSSESGWWLPAP